MSLPVNGDSVTISECCHSASAEPPNWTPDSPVVWPAASRSPGPLRGWLAPYCHNPSLHGC